MLRLILIGLIALVPDRDRGSLTIVLPEARSFHQHYPVFIYRPAAPCTSPAVCIPPILSGANVLEKSTEFKARILDGEEILVRGLAAGNGRLRLANGREHRFWHGFTGEVPGSSAEGQDFSWVPSMNAVSPAAKAISNRHLLSPHPMEISSVLRLHRVEGDVRVLSFADIGGFIYSFTFKKASSNLSIFDVKQALADIVMIEIPLAGREVEFVFRKFFPDGAAEAPLRLSKVDGSVDVVLGNLPPYLTKDKCGSLGSGPHFAAYYPLSSAAAPSVQIPFLDGSPKIPVFDVETPWQWPRIVKFVEGTDPCLNFVTLPEPGLLASGVVTAASNRPICAEVSFEAPSGF